MSSRERRALVIGGSVLLLAAIAAAALVLTAGGSGSGLATPRVLPAAQPRFPGPPRGAVVYAREDGADALALAVVPRQHGVGLQASVVDGNGAGVAGLHVSFRVTARDGASTIPGTACGTGCYHGSVNLETRPLAVRVRVARPGRPTTWNVNLPATWPPASGSAIIARAARVWKGLRTLSYLDRLASDATNVLVTHWQAVAPDRLAYRIDAGSQAIIIGLKRWDRASGASSLAEQPGAPSPSTSAVLGQRDRRARARERTLRRPSRLARLLLRPANAGLVPRRDRQEDAADARPPHDRDRALHARHLRPVQRAHRDQPAEDVK